ncbi:hypothetical protein LTR36_010226 [Oleoguttula mirabilis]|uniref:Uncharacterized protein n=1 Tax=Oleoguttula mirabilis TaxID=1507867 RepID=A0AAV9JRT7_9PEZI|nr:hypothetical protein LTR36_010226 [Oleoguttula mirabilis]
MRTSTTAWAAALAVMSMTGPYTKAEAAPAQRSPEQDPERAKYYFPRHAKRSYSNTTSSAVDTNSASSIGDATSSYTDLPSTSQSSSSPPPASTTASPTPTTTGLDFQSIDPMSILESMLEGGYLPETANTVVTTTIMQTRENNLAGKYEQLDAFDELDKCAQHFECGDNDQYAELGKCIRANCVLIKLKQSRQCAEFFERVFLIECILVEQRGYEQLRATFNNISQHICAGIDCLLVLFVHLAIVILFAKLQLVQLRCTVVGLE